MKTTDLQIGKEYQLNNMKSCNGKAVYEGIKPTPAGLLWMFRATERTPLVRNGQTFSIQYDATGLKIL